MYLKTLTFVKTDVIVRVISLYFSNFSLRVLDSYLVSSSWITWHLLLRKSSSLHFLGATRVIINVYLVFFLLCTLTFPVIPHINTIVFCQFSTSFLIAELCLALSS